MINGSGIYTCAIDDHGYVVCRSNNSISLSRLFSGLLTRVMFQLGLVERKLLLRHMKSQSVVGVPNLFLFSVLCRPLFVFCTFLLTIGLTVLLRHTFSAYCCSIQKHAINYRIGGNIITQISNLVFCQHSSNPQSVIFSPGYNVHIYLNCMLCLLSISW